MKNIPNMLSAFRIVLVPIFVVAYFSDESAVKVYAAIVYAFAVFTDFLDGYLARKFDLTSDLGKVLDPLGDKVMTLAVLLCITIDEVIPVWSVIVFFIKETMMLIGGIIIHAKTKSGIPSANYLGKVSTVVFFLTCVVLMLFRDIPAGMASNIISVAIVFMLMALVSYIMTFIGIIKKTRKI